MVNPPDDQIDAKITFPCDDYPIKIMGDGAPDFENLVSDVVKKHAPDLDVSKNQRRASRNQRFLSVTVFIRATGIAQLQAIHEDLKLTGRVKMVI